MFPRIPIADSKSFFDDSKKGVIGLKEFLVYYHAHLTMGPTQFYIYYKVFSEGISTKKVKCRQEGVSILDRLPV